MAVGKLQRTSAHRAALFRNMSAALIKHEQITTTLAKAKELRPYIGELRDPRQEGRPVEPSSGACAPARGDSQLVKLFDVVATRYAARNGGYTRVIKAGIRASDASPMAIIEFVDRDVSAKGQDSAGDDGRGFRRRGVSRRTPNDRGAAPAMERPLSFAAGA
ncbi:50S ribosomal protein L17 [Sphingomonas sp. MMS24-JH45]